jgi:HK97 family phage prohead protease
MSTTTEAPTVPAGTEFRQFSSDLEIWTRAKGGDGRTVRGIAVPWDEWIDVYGDGWLYESFTKGAVDHQFSALQRIKVADRHMYRGGKLIGVTRTAKNQRSGLYWEGYVSKTPDGDNALELANDGALDQLSVGFREVDGGNKFRVDPETNLELPNWIQRVKVDLFEVALVPEGAYGASASVHGIRDAGHRSRPAIVDDRERRLRDALAELGYSSDEIERAAGVLKAPDKDAELFAWLGTLPKAADLV